LISWNRVLEGRLRDPLVGRDILIGIMFGAFLGLLRNGSLLFEVMSPEMPEPDLMNAMGANTYAVSFLLGQVFDSVNIPLALFLMFSILRIVISSILRIAFRDKSLDGKWLAGAGLIAMVNLYVNTPYFEISGLIIATAFCVLWLLGVTRFGLIAGMSLWFADRIFRAWSMLAPASWYSGRMYLLLAAVLILSLYAFVRSIGDRPLVPAEFLAEPGGQEKA
jgi:hypothetical protein